MRELDDIILDCGAGFVITQPLGVNKPVAQGQVVTTTRLYPVASTAAPGRRACTLKAAIYDSSNNIVQQSKAAFFIDVLPK